MTGKLFPPETPLTETHRLVMMRPEHLDPAAKILASAEPWQSYGFDVEALRDFLEGSIRAGVARSVIFTPAGKEGAPDECAGVLIVHPGFLGGRFLEILALSPAHRNIGLGRKIIRAVCSEMPDHMRDLFALVAVSNTEALAFYKKLDFKDIGDLPGLVFADKTERLIWLRFR